MTSLFMAIIYKIYLLFRPVSKGNTFLSVTWLPKEVVMRVGFIDLNNSTRSLAYSFWKSYDNVRLQFLVNNA